MKRKTRPHHPLALLLTSLAVLALAVACGGSDEVTSAGSTSPTAAATRATSAPATPGPGVTTEPSTPATCETPSASPAPEVTLKTYTARPPLTIDPAKTYLAHIWTTRGHFIIKLRPDLAPEHVNSFVFLANDGFYDGVTFHRVVKDFVAQTGDPTGAGSGGPGYTVPLEPSAEPFVRGVVGMARTSDPDSAGSQWFVTLKDSLFLNNTADPLNKRYTVFGEVVFGMEVVDCLQIGDKITSLPIQEQ